jgi:hypothetical protein
MCRYNSLSGSDFTAYATRWGKPVNNFVFSYLNLKTTALGKMGAKLFLNLTFEPISTIGGNR